MHLKILHPNTSPGSLIRFALSSDSVAQVLHQALCDTVVMGEGARLLIPENWGIESFEYGSFEGKKLALNIPQGENTKQSHFIISNGRFATQIDPDLLERIIAASKSDIVAINIEPQLSAYRENYRFAPNNQVAGCRRLYSDIANYAEMPKQWPHLMIVKNGGIEKILEDGQLPVEFDEFSAAVKKAGLQICAIDAGGSVLDLETERGLMSLLTAKLKTIVTPAAGSDCDMAKDARLVGKVVVGKNVTIDEKALVIGPAVIGDNVTISDGVIVNSCVIADDITVPADGVVQYRLVKDSSFDWKAAKSGNSKYTCPPFEDFKLQTSKYDQLHRWHRFSYPVFLKRGLDIVFSSVMLMLFAPVFVLVAIALKINSPGPLFYRARRQGRGGNEFDCLKFRTMIVGADKMQDNLRVVNQIDGPQFKMEDDPRISAVGKFLRNTSIDEIPQFINVFKGQMSVVGPRPSPESENTLCPSWRDVRLSVKPGITGLWQVCRTREPSRDFQEWIHYDTKYVKNISLKQDLWIAWKTATQLISEFVKQF